MSSPHLPALAAAGQDLGEHAIQRSRRPPAPPSCRITDRDLQLLAFLHDFNYATTSQLAALFWGLPGTASPPARRLKILHDAALLDRLRPRVLAGGSAEWIHHLTHRGWETLAAHGLTADGHHFTAPHITSLSYLEHDLHVVSLIAAIAAHAARHHTRQYGGLLQRAGFEVLGPRSGRIDPRHEHRPLNASQASQLDASLDVELADCAPGVLEPDATLLGRTPAGKRAAILLEYDRTRRAAKQTTRLRRYDYFLTLGWRDTRYAQLDLEPLLLLVCAAPQQLTTFADVIDRQLAAHIHPAGSNSLRHGDYPGRELTALTTRPRLLTGDWHVDKAPALPPNARTNTDPNTPHTVELPLDRLFATGHPRVAAA